MPLMTHAQDSHMVASVIFSLSEPKCNPHSMGGGNWDLPSEDSCKNCACILKLPP